MVRRALLCGVNAYVDQPLRGCINDVHQIQAVLLENFGFPADQIQVLLDEDCVRSRLLDRWRWLTEGATAGDVLVFHFSGHGSYVPDQDGEETDLRDEITCLQDFDFDDPQTYITDDEWFQLGQAVDSGVHLLIIKDTCHSGGSSRFIGVRQDSGVEKIILANTRELGRYQAGDVIAEESVSNARFIVPPQLPAEAWQQGGAARGKTARSTLVSTSLMACGEAQTAADACINGSYHGAFTHSLCTALRQASVADSEGLIREVAALLHGRYDQIPQHEGRPFTLSLLAGSAPVDRPVTSLMRPVSASIDQAGKNPSDIRPSDDNATDVSVRPLVSPQQMVFEAHLRFLETMRALHG
ncbi:MAG: caspase domain-containing protein [Cyanobacteriota bacterium]